MERPPPSLPQQEGDEEPKNPNSVFAWGMMPPNTDLLTSSENVYRQVKTAGAQDVVQSGVVRNAASAGLGRPRKYGERVYWTRGQDGEYHNVQPDHVVLEAPLSVASARQVTLEDLIGIHGRNEAGEVENTLPTIREELPRTVSSNPSVGESTELINVRKRLGLDSE